MKTHGKLVMAAGIGFFGLGAAALLISDSHGVHYLIRDLSRLDKTSRRLLDRFM